MMSFSFTGLIALMSPDYSKKAFDKVCDEHYNINLLLVTFKISAPDTTQNSLTINLIGLIHSVLN